MHIKGLGLGGLVTLAALIGCGSSSPGGSTGNGGGGTSGGGPFTTSVAPGTKLTGLTPAQVTQLCADIDNYVQQFLFPSLCDQVRRSNAAESTYRYLQQNPTATNAQLQAMCAQSEADTSCLFDADGGTETCNASSIPSCQATVGNYSKCLNDESGAENQFIDSIPSCSSLTAASLNAFFAADGGVSTGPTEPTSCSMFDSTCDVDAGTAAMTNMTNMTNMSARLRRKR